MNAIPIGRFQSLHSIKTERADGYGRMAPVSTARPVGSARGADHAERESPIAKRRNEADDSLDRMATIRILVSFVAVMHHDDVARADPPDESCHERVG